MMSSEPRVRLEPCGRLGLWIYIDGKVMDLIYYSNLQKINGIKQETIDAIEQIYEDFIGEEE